MNVHDDDAGGAARFQPLNSSHQSTESYEMSMNSQSASGALRRRNIPGSSIDENNRNGHPASSFSATGNTSSRAHIVRNLDFMFPKVETEFTVKTERGGAVSLFAYVLVAILSLTECLSWYSANRQTTDKVFVDTSLGKKMRVNLNVTFHALACEDLHVDVMDVAGDAQ
jgi:endoplasmic reticulum-Golgi intermediate compartment protein 3